MGKSSGRDGSVGRGKKKGTSAKVSIVVAGDIAGNKKGRDSGDGEQWQTVASDDGLRDVGNGSNAIGGSDWQRGATVALKGG
ncbi:hypothetical protein B296_00000667 [Ensete ventricosum]|uniref:Uncharacterized protein n=1 Tax=Ensete ventricosum TaxID=4639 RepID=A0A426Z0S3_ENSVE|nr:hypothetical protein B296_00000667 [Ensete ventricosum]